MTWQGNRYNDSGYDSGVENPEGFVKEEGNKEPKTCKVTTATGSEVEVDLLSQEQTKDMISQNPLLANLAESIPQEFSLRLLGINKQG